MAMKTNDLALQDAYNSANDDITPLSTSELNKLQAHQMDTLAANRIYQYQNILEQKYGEVLLGIEDEFTVHGVDYREKDAVIDRLSHFLSSKYGKLFSSIDDEHPLMRVKDSVAAGQNGALHCPDTFRLELVTNHEPFEYRQGNDLVGKVEMLAAMRRDIAEFLDAEYGESASVSWNPRPIKDLYTYLKQASNLSPREIVRSLKEQALERDDLIGREKILSARTLEDMLLGDDAPINNRGAAGSGVHINLGFQPKGARNPFYNAANPDEGTPVTWNSAAGIIDVTAESVLGFVNLHRGSWDRIGHADLSAPVEACFNPLKKGGAIVKQNPQTAEFYAEHGLPNQVTVNEKNAHIEIRHADGGAGLRDGRSLLMMQLCSSLGAMHYGLEVRENPIQSYDELLEYRKPICASFEESLEKFKNSDLLKDVYGPDLHEAMAEYIETSPARLIEEQWCDPRAVAQNNDEFAPVHGPLPI